MLGPGEARRERILLLKFRHKEGLDKGNKNKNKNKKGKDEKLFERKINKIW